MKIGKLINSKLGMGIMLVLLAGVLTNAWQNLSGESSAGLIVDQVDICELERPETTQIVVELQQSRAELAFEALRLAELERDLAIERRLVLDLEQAINHESTLQENDFHLDELAALFRELQEMERELALQNDELTEIRVQTSEYDQPNTVIDINNGNDSQVVVLKDIKIRQ